MEEVQNAANPKKVQKAKFKEKNLRKQELADIRRIMDMTEGRRFMWRYLGKCGVYKSSFTGNSATYFNEGKRDVGLQLIADVIEADDEMYLKMMRENKGE